MVHLTRSRVATSPCTGSTPKTADIYSSLIKLTHLDGIILPDRAARARTPELAHAGVGAAGLLAVAQQHR